MKMTITESFSSLQQLNTYLKEKKIQKITIIDCYIIGSISSNLTAFVLICNLLNCPLYWILYRIAVYVALLLLQDEFIVNVALHMLQNDGCPLSRIRRYMFLTFYLNSRNCDSIKVNYQIIICFHLKGFIYFRIKLFHFLF